MTKLLNGLELVGYIKERQAKQVRNLRQAHGIIPKLAIIVTTDNPVIATYMRLKTRYGEDILIETDIHHTAMDDIDGTIDQLNADPSVHGIIVQLPLADTARTEQVVKRVVAEKDVDGLGEQPKFDPATAMAIDWLIAGYGIELASKHIAIVGRGRLVGGPLEKLWLASGYDVITIDTSVADLATELKKADIIVSATGVPGLITTDMVTQNAVIIDAGTASENGQIVGDVAADVREREDITITPLKGGVGPLTVAALFDNVITAAGRMIHTTFS